MNVTVINFQDIYMGAQVTALYFRSIGDTIQLSKILNFRERIYEFHPRSWNQMPPVVEKEKSMPSKRKMRLTDEHERS
jgi:hypothetical protein